MVQRGCVGSPPQVAVKLRSDGATVIAPFVVLIALMVKVAVAGATVMFEQLPPVSVQINDYTYRISRGQSVVVPEEVGRILEESGYLNFG